MILLLGASGYMGQSFARELKLRGCDFRPLSRKDLDYTSFPVLLNCLQRTKPWFLINAAGHTEEPNVDACETEQADTLLGNTLLPQTIAHACAAAGVPWGHVSSGCIYAGVKIAQPDGSMRVEKDLTQPNIHKLLVTQPEVVRGFTEEDTPNFSFRQPPCSFYSGTKALGEESIALSAAVSAASSGTVPVPGEEVPSRRVATETRNRDGCATLDRVGVRPKQ